MKVKANNSGGIDVFTNTDDACFECLNNTDCPLIEALRNELVIMHYEEIEIQKCKLQKKRKNSEVNKCQKLK